MRFRTLSVLAVLGMVVAAHAQFVYNSRDGQAATVSGTLLNTGVADSDFWGDQILLAPGTGRIATLLEQVFQVNPTAGDTNNFSYSFDLQLNSISGGVVGASFYSASYSAAPVAPTLAAFLYGFSLPNIVVPDEFVYSFRMHRLAGSNTGIIGMQAHNSAPLVGSSDPAFFWDQNPTSGVWSQFAFTGGNANFRARLTAVPEPASMAVLGMGALALIRRRRSKKA